eukprot:CAMPEP_0202475430 /NCGR_PEP_ID=MMETSP1360-20130828/92898_1 /ASSEMBLY_ACC=CAM_ASM_000848 /TAXON_ID=515479 /ORGANISM="Licmophora paradoxa, Strain CCMP2313" /LENGTH=240 /DNA_ID=CAMNT_0049102593 /DNA_START=328 /DNA_END=1047 /DNA_ORIENTATION=+
MFSSVDPNVIIGAQLLISVSWAAKNEVQEAALQKEVPSVTPFSHIINEEITGISTSTQVLHSEPLRVRAVSIDDAASVVLESSQTSSSPEPIILFSKPTVPEESKEETGITTLMTEKIIATTAPQDEHCNLQVNKVEDDTPSPSWDLDNAAGLTRKKRSVIKQKNTKTIKRKYYKSSYVGTKTKHKVKAVIRRKFSWKNYPELENLLIKRRAEYLQISFTHNYTTYQKEYNNMIRRKFSW